MCHVNCMVIFDSFVDLVTCQDAAVAIWVAIAGYPIRYDRAHLCLVTRLKKIARRPPPSLMSLRSCSKTARLIDSVLLRSHRVMPGHPGGYDPFPPAPALLAHRWTRYPCQTKGTKTRKVVACRGWCAVRCGCGRCPGWLR